MNPSDYTIREAEEGDFQSIEKLFEQRRTRTGWTTWKYLKNPDGLARVFIAEDASSNIVGTLAYVPRQYSNTDGDSLTVLRAVDIFLCAELRKQGVFFGLLKFARKQVDGTRLGVPNEYSAIFGKGPGWRVLGPYRTWRFPVLMGEFFSGKTMAFSAPLVNGLSRIYQICWLPGDYRNLMMKRITRFRKDYGLDPAVIHGVRSAEYLNWRFVDNPVGNYNAFEFFEKNESVGYCVFARVGSSAILSDFVTNRCRRRCLRLLIDHCRAARITQVIFSGTGLSLGWLGFIPWGDSRDCVAYKPPHGQWVVTGCDIDSEPSVTLLNVHA